MHFLKIFNKKDIDNKKFTCEYCGNIFSFKNSYYRHRKNRCRKFCQGTYAAYLMTENDRIFLRACHRHFQDQRNEFEIPRTVLRKKDRPELMKILQDVWKYAYER